MDGDLADWLWISGYEKLFRLSAASLIAIYRRKVRALVAGLVARPMRLAI